MKKNILTFALMLVVSSIFAQDIIVDYKGEEIKGYVISLNAENIIYATDSAGVEQKTISTNNVSKIIYKNGVTAVLRELKTIKTNDTCYVATKDADELYDSPLAYTFAPTLFLPPVGLVVAIVRSQEMNDDEIKASHPLLLESKQYKDCYKHRAKRKRTGRAWAGFGIGMGVYAAVGIVYATFGILYSLGGG